LLYSFCRIVYIEYVYVKDCTQFVILEVYEYRMHSFFSTNKYYIFVIFCCINIRNFVEHVMNISSCENFIFASFPYFMNKNTQFSVLFELIWKWM
jgi:hypothetical protein